MPLPPVPLELPPVPVVPPVPELPPVPDVPMLELQAPEIIANAAVIARKADWTFIEGAPSRGGLLGGS